MGKDNQLKRHIEVTDDEIIMYLEDGKKVEINLKTWKIKEPNGLKFIEKDEDIEMDLYHSSNRKFYISYDMDSSELDLAYGDDLNKEFKNSFVTIWFNQDGSFNYYMSINTNDIEEWTLDKSKTNKKIKHGEYIKDITAEKGAPKAKTRRTQNRDWRRLEESNPV